MFPCNKGYHIYAAAVVAKFDPEWMSQYDDKVLNLIRDISEPSGQDPYYTQSRSKDWFIGHSWANGIANPLPDGHNQESTSESVNAYYAIYLYGLATGNTLVKDLGRLQLAQEIRATKKYWQIKSTDDIYPAPFSDNKIVGIIWTSRASYTTFFGDNTEFIHCIQMLPFTPISEELLPRDWIEEEYEVLSTALDTATDAWRGYIIMAHAIVDKEAAWQEAQSLATYDDGNTKSNTLYWLATRT